MNNATTGWITVLLRLPVFYNPDAAGYRASVEDDKFLETADELARRFGGGSLFVFRHDPPRGFWWDHGVVDGDVLALIQLDVPDATESRDWLASLRARRTAGTVPAEGHLSEICWSGRTLDLQ